MASYKRGKKKLNTFYRVTVLLDNFVDKDVQSMLLPLNLMQNILFCPKYRIKDNFIYPNGFVTKLVSLCVMILSTISYCYQVYKQHIDNNIRNYVIISYISAYIELFMYFVGFIINYVINVLQTQRNISFILKVQQVHRFMNETCLFKRFIIWNWISVIAIFGSYAICLIYFIVGINTPAIDAFNFWVSLFCFDLNYITAIRFIKLLGNKVHVWKIQTKHLRHMDHSESESYCRKMFQAYVNILECYEIYKKSFQYTVWLIIL